MEWANVPLRRRGLELVHSWNTHWWVHPASFRLGGREYSYFYHPYNCGWPPYANERCVELALANVWLGRVDPGEVVEVGAVTPYYWPGRLRTVIDPYDPHELVSARTSVLEVDLTNRTVLSISTIEHIGAGDYGPPIQPGLAVDAMEKIFREASRFLVTVPTGLNDALDDFLFRQGAVPADVEVRCLQRRPDESWEEAPPARESIRAYGDEALARRFPGTHVARRANCVVLLRRPRELE